ERSHGGCHRRGWCAKDSESAESCTLPLHDALPILGREGKAAKARLDAHPPKHEGVPEAETSALEISERLETARAHNRARAEAARSEEHTSELQSREKLVCRRLLEKKSATGTTAA